MNCVARVALCVLPCLRRPASAAPARVALCTPSFASRLARAALRVPPCAFRHVRAALARCCVHAAPARAALRSPERAVLRMPICERHSARAMLAILRVETHVAIPRDVVCMAAKGSDRLSTVGGRSLSVLLFADLRI